MFGERRFARQRRLETEIAVGGAAAAALDALPVRSLRAGRGRRRVVLRVAAAFVGIDVVVVGIEVAVAAGHRPVFGKGERGFGGQDLFALAFMAVALGGGGSGFARARFEQRIALQFLFDIFGKLEIRQLQQLDRLLKLARHDQGLPLAKFESRR